MGIECGLRPGGISHKALWQHASEVETTTRMEIAGWLRSGAEVRDVERNAILSTRVAATSDGLVSLGLRVDLRIVIGVVQEESMGPVEASVVQGAKS